LVRPSRVKQMRTENHIQGKVGCPDHSASHVDQHQGY
jgi:hypothetical protein